MMNTQTALAQVLRREGFLSSSECEGLISVYERNAAAATAKDRMGNPLCAYLEMAYRDLEGGRRMMAAMRKAEAAIRDTYRPEQLYFDAMFISKMKPGDFVPVHADNERRTGLGWEPNHTPHRSHSAIIYLNDVEAGGAIIVKNPRTRIVPRAGLLVGFPCDRNAEHYVEPLLSGYRYAALIWFTEQLSQSFRYHAKEAQ